MEDDDEQLEILNQDIEIPSDITTYNKKITESLKEDAERPRPVRIQMQQLKNHINNEIQKSRQKYILNLQYQMDHLELPEIKTYNNQFLQYKCRRKLQQKSQQPKQRTERSFTRELKNISFEYEPQSNKILYNKYLRLHKQIKNKLTDKLQNKENMLILMQNKLEIAEKLIGGKNHPKMMLLIERMRQKVETLTQLNNILSCLDQYNENKSTVRNTVKQEYNNKFICFTQFLSLLQTVEAMDQQLFEILMNYMTKNVLLEESSNFSEDRQNIQNRKIRSFVGQRKQDYHIQGGLKQRFQ